MLSPTFAGSADDFLPLHQDADKRYVRKVAGDCTGEDRCLKITSNLGEDIFGKPYSTNRTSALDDFDTSEDKTETPFNVHEEELFLSFRSYMEPSTLGGLDDNELRVRAGNLLRLVLRGEIRESVT